MVNVDRIKPALICVDEQLSTQPGSSKKNPACSNSCFKVLKGF